MEIQNNQAPMTPVPKKSVHYTVLIVIALVLVAVVELVLLMNKNGGFPSAVTTDSNRVEEEALREGASEGVFTLVASSGTVQVGVPVVLSVTADSNKHGVVGFDAVFEYDRTAFSLGSVTSSLPGFTAVGSARKQYLEVTSAKDPQTVVTPVLNGTEVLKITLNPLKSGSYPIKLVDKVGSSSTKFVDSETDVFKPQTNSVTVTVK